MIDGLQRPDVMALPPEIRNQVLFDKSATATGVGALMVFDEQGDLRIQSTSAEPHWIEPVGDRDYFQAQREADAGLFISRPYLSRLIDKEVVGLSRRRSNLDGSFGGVALATIQLAYSEELFTSLHLVPGAVLSLIRTDGAALLRMEPGGFRRTGDFAASPVFQAIGQRGSGDYVENSIVDGVERFFSFTRVGDLPLILTIGIPTASMYGDWVLKGALVVLVLAVISAALVFLSIRLAAADLVADARQIAIDQSLGRADEVHRVSPGCVVNGLRARYTAHMTDEAEARARLLAHYEDRLLLLAEKLVVAEAEFAADRGQAPAKQLKSIVTRLQREIVSTREKERRLRDPIGPR